MHIRKGTLGSLGAETSNADLEAQIRARAAAAGLPDITFISPVNQTYAGFTNPQTGSTYFTTGLVQLPDGRTLQASEFFDSPTNNATARLSQYASIYSGGESTANESGESVYHPAVRIENLSRPGSVSTFQIGDKFRLSVNNAKPNAPVSVATSQNGAGSSSTYGNTDANGSFEVSGTMAAEHLGAWSEQWTVGGGNAGTIAFSVVEAAKKETPPPAKQPGEVPASGTGTEKKVPPPAPADDKTPATGDWWDSILTSTGLTQNQLLIGGAVTAGLLFVLGRSK